MSERWVDRLVDGWLRAPSAVRWCVPLAGMGALWWSSSRTASDGLPRLGGPLAHNAMHVVAYACIAGSAWLAWSRRPVRAPQRMRSIGSWSVAAAYGVVDELHHASSFAPQMRNKVWLVRWHIQILPHGNQI